jgi:hypothetical protein
MNRKKELTLDEMRAVVTEADDVAFSFRQAERREWARKQREKAAEILVLLQRHIPADRLPEMESYLSNSFACDFFRDALWRDLIRNALRRYVPAEHWGEIEYYFVSGHSGTEVIRAAFQALRSKEGWTPPARPRPG